LLAFFTTTIAAAQKKNLVLGVIFVCDGERMFIENCNMRDLSDNANYLMISAQ
jgi:hypothetical protein